MPVRLTIQRRHYIGALQIIDRTTWQASPVYNNPDPVVPLELPSTPTGRQYLLSISHGAGFGFRLLDDGTVIPDDPNKESGIEFGHSNIAIKTCNVQIVTRKYWGPATVANVPPHPANHYSLPMGIVGTDYQSGYILEFAPGCAIRFNVDCKGNIGLSADYAPAAIVNGRKIELNTCKIEIEPKQDVRWTIAYAVNGMFKGKKVVDLVPAVPADIADRGYILVAEGLGTARFGTRGDGAPDRDTVTIASAGGTVEFKLAKH